MTHQENKSYIIETALLTLACVLMLAAPVVGYMMNHCV